MRLPTLLPRLWTNWITLLGSVLTTVSGFALLVLLVFELGSSRQNPYLGLFAALALPAVFVCGLLLIPLGLFLERRRTGSDAKDALQAAFELAFRDRSARARILFVAAATSINVVLFAYAGRATVQKMDSPKFCGQACHSVMAPEWDSWNRSPHAHVACVECHIGPGATPYLKAKWNGMHQMAVLVAGNYHRPVPTPVATLRSAKDTCEECHAPASYRPERIKLYPHYDLDKDNTPKFNALALRVGGLNPRSRKYEGIHSHANPDRQIEYEYLDNARTKIGKISVREKGLLVATYEPAENTGKALGKHEMDCIDCHNRQGHAFEGSAKEAVDRAIFTGLLDSKLPFVAQMSVEVLSQSNVARDRAEPYLRAAIQKAYAAAHPELKPEPAALDKVASALTGLYLESVYPEMQLRWNTYRSNLSHRDDGGCFRCHDKRHEAVLASGKKKKLGQDCDLCHAGITFDANPAKFDDTLAAMMPGN